MNNLLTATFYRLKKDTIMWLFLFTSIGLAGITIFRNQQNMKIGINVELDELVSSFTVIIGLFISIFVSIFVGKEYSDGIIRNKIIRRT